MSSVPALILVICKFTGYNVAVITSFRHKGLERLFEEDNRRGVSPAIAPKLKRMLFALDTASHISDMGHYPGWRLHPLKGDLAGLWSLTVASNWRPRLPLP
jgi:proteic killer suppression protein